MLDQIKVPDDGPVIITLYGEAGRGKTSLAATFPKPIFIMTEDGLRTIPKDKRPPAFPLVKSVDELKSQVKALITEEHEYKTVVIDSISGAEELFIKHIVRNDPNNPLSIDQACGGFGKGRAAVGALHGWIRLAADKLKQKGMNVVFIAHSTVDHIDPPDSDGYTMYNVAVNTKNSAPHYVNNVDLVGFIKIQSYAMGDGDRKKAVSTGDRVLTCVAEAGNVSKNRFGITDDIEVKPGENPLVKYIPELGE